MKEVEVLYTKGENAVTPTQGYDDDFAMDVYAAKGTLVPPSTFKSVLIPTNISTAFDPKKVGLHVALRSGVAYKTPLVMPNSPGIIEGTYRGSLGILVRNCFIDNSLVDFVYNIKGEKVPLSEVPEETLEAARTFFNEENERLGYEPSTSELGKSIFVTKVPRGTVYVAQDDRIAQIWLADKFKINFKRVAELPPTTRGEGGFGSSGTSKK